MQSTDYDATRAIVAVSVNVSFWHKPDLRLAAPEGPFTGGLPTFGAECLVSGGKPTVF
jgi:hypothetical protein